MYNYEAATLGSSGSKPIAPSGPSHNGAPGTGKPSVELTSSQEALEGKYLAQIKKSKTLTVLLESEKTRSRQLEEQLNEANAKLEKLTRQQQRQQQRVGGKVKAAAGTAANVPVSRRLPFLDMTGDDDDKDNGSGGEGEGYASSTVKQLRERLDRAYAQVRERDVQLSEAKREGALLRTILGRELGKTPEELTSWLTTATTGSGGSGRESSSDAPDGWKSRAEQIVLLKGKLKDMERLVAAYQAGEGPTTVGNEAVDQRGVGTVSCASSGSSRPSPQTQPPMRQEDVAALVAAGGDDLESLMLLARQTAPADTLAGTDGIGMDGGTGKRGPRSNSRLQRQGGHAAPSVQSQRTGVSYGAASTATHRRDVDDDARDAISDLAGKRLKTLREVEAALANALQELKEEKGKQPALAARVASLQRDNAQLRAHVQTMLEKSKDDDELVAAYKAELEDALGAMQDLKREIAELQEEEAEEARQAAQRDGSHRATATVDEALRKENASLKARIAALEAASSAAGLTSTPGSTEVQPDYAERVARWAHTVARTAADTAEGTAEAPSLSPQAPPAVAALLRAAHGHILLVETQLQQRERDGVLVGSGGSATSAPPALLRENANLKERIRSLTDLLRKEAQVPQ